MKLITPLALLMALMLPTHAKKSAPDTPEPSSPTPGASMERLKIPSSKARITTLPNGLTIIVEEDRNAPVASVQVWVGTGSIHEGKWMGAGLSHILEHMLFKGTEKRGAGEIARSVQDQGGYINAYTSFDRTVYWIDVPAAGASTAIDILADAMLHSTLPEAEYEKEQEVIRREFAMGFDDPGRVSSQLMFRTLFSDSPYRHPVIGYLDVFNQLTRADVMEYYKLRYVPNNMFFVVVGDVDADSVVKQITELVGDAPRMALDPIYIPEESPQIGRRDAHEAFPTEITRFSLSWRVPPVTHADIPALDVLGEIMGGSDSSPLNQEIREQKQLAFSIGSGSYALADGGVIAIQGVCEPGKRSVVESEALAIVERLKQPGAITEADVEKARKSVLTSSLSGLTTMRGKASDTGSNWLLTRNLNFSTDYLDAVNAVTIDDVVRVANQYLNPETVTATSLSPIGTDVAEKAADKPKESVEIKEFTLSNGLRLIVRPNSRLPIVTMVAVFQGGLLAETPENNGISRLLANAITKATTTRNAAQIAEAVDSMGGELSAASGNNSITLTGFFLSSDFDAGLDLFADVIQNPTFPAVEVEKERAAQVAGIKAEEDQITAVARNVLRENLFGDHPYALRGMGSAKTVPGLTRDDVIAHHQSLFTGSNGVLAIFGDVDPDRVFQEVSKAFASLPKGTDVDTSFPDGPIVKEPRSIKEIRDKNQAVVMVGFPGLDMFDPDRAVLDVIETASSDLGSRFFDRIREELGLAYFVGATQLSGPTPGAIVFYVGTDPAKSDQVRGELIAEIAKLAESGLTDEEISRAKMKLHGAEAIADQSDRAMAQAVGLDVLFGLGVEEHQARRAKVDAVTAEDVRRVAKKILDAGRSIDVTVMPDLTQSKLTAAP